jgi:rhodanese-related sulfurtransferase/mannose-6-phosphate isomerase-like protein (cupin superfamily)
VGFLFTTTFFPIFGGGVVMQVATDNQVEHEEKNRARIATGQSASANKSPEELADIVSVFAASEGWMERVKLQTDRRWYERLCHGPDYDIWVISWLPGQSTGFHDHGASSGAVVVATGSLEEHRPGGGTRVIYPGKPLAFGADYTHDVRNVSIAPAISIHAYSPPLTEMNEYELDDGRLVPRERAAGEIDSVDQAGKPAKRSYSDRADALTIEQVLAAARTRLRRLSPDEAYQATVGPGAVLVDIRPEAQRAVEGIIPGALIVERNVLEWRFDPASSARLPIATSHELQVVVFCSEGYTSSLAAAALQDLGLYRATDIIGGFKEWKRVGLPVSPPARRSRADLRLQR